MALLLIPPRELCMYLENRNIAVVDLREKENYIKSHIKNAINIPYEKLEDHYAELRKFSMVILYCNRGNQSLLAAKNMDCNGFHVASISGGYTAYKMMLCR